MLLFGRDQNADPTASLTQKESELLPWAMGYRSQTCRLWWRCQEDKLHTRCPWVLCLERRIPQDFFLCLWLGRVQHSLCDLVIPAQTLHYSQQLTHFCISRRGKSIKCSGPHHTRCPQGTGSAPRTGPTIQRGSRGNTRAGLHRKNRVPKARSSWPLRWFPLTAPEVVSSHGTRGVSPHDP